jgi:VanZ family protein
LLSQWFPVALWLGVLMLESTDLMSAQHTGSFLYSVLTAVFGHIDKVRVAMFHGVLRKTGHFVGYGILGLLFFRALHATVSNGLARLWCWSVVLTCVVASLDEWHQSFIPSRTGCFHDVMLDTCGGAALLLVAIATIHIRRSATD